MSPKDAPSTASSRRRKPSRPSSTSASRASSSGAKRRITRDDERWTTDDDGDETEDLLSEPKRPKKQAPKRSTRSSKPSFFRRLGKLALFIAPYLIPLVPYILLTLGLYLGIALLRSYLYSYLSLLPVPSFLLAPLGRLASLHLPLLHLPLRPILSVPCASLGLLCPPGQGRHAQFELLSAGAARTAAMRAKHAVDVFDHLVKLADPEESVGLSLHPVECWELATAVRYTSTLDDREHLSQQLGQLGDLSREVKENVIGLNAQGMNAMVWIVHEFTRLEELLARAASSGSSLSAKEQAAFTSLLDSLFSRISTSLSELLTSLDRALPSATLASDSARRIFSAVKASEAQRLGEWDQLDWPTKLLDAVGGEKAKHLRRDLELARASAGAVMGVWEALEKTREALVGYSAHVGHFKAGVVGFHLSGHGLSVADEVASLQLVIGEMREVVEAARATRGGGSGRRKGRVAELEA
ncbi:hypothetical protein JCM8097_004109 [Rhodosporidiobolus ruineniae]